MSNETTDNQKIEHPLDEFLNIESGEIIEADITDENSTELAVIDETSPDAYDDKDIQIERQIDDVYTRAIDAFDNSAEEVEYMEPKFRARSQEVASQFLNTALAAARDKLSIKQGKDKLSVASMKAKGPNTLNQNLIVADRNELLRQLIEGDTFDGETDENN